LSAVRKNGAIIASYAYDALNFRIRRSDKDGNKSYYAYGRQGALTYQYDVKTRRERRIAYFGATIVGWKDSIDGVDTTYYAVSDNLGSVTEVQGATGTVLWESEYLAFGKVAGVLGDLPFDGFFTGKDLDADTGLRYHWNRWTSPDGSRFMSEDPARDGVNWYGYCGGNPVNSTDPTGLDYYGTGTGTTCDEGWFQVFDPVAGEYGSDNYDISDNSGSIIDSYITFGQYGSEGTNYLPAPDIKDPLYDPINSKISTTDAKGLARGVAVGSSAVEAIMGLALLPTPIGIALMVHGGLILLQQSYH
jgi:RHS repeat-associated protein